MLMQGNLEFSVLQFFDAIVLETSGLVIVAAPAIFTSISAQKVGKERIRSRVEGSNLPLKLDW